MRRSFSHNRRANLAHVALRASIVGVVLLALPAVPVATAQQVNPEEVALILLGSAQKAYNDKNYPVAADRFRDFIRQFGGRREAVSAQYGLGLSLIEQPGRNWDEVIQALQGPAGDATFPEQRFALYQLGVAHRARAVAEYRLSLERPNEAPQHIQAALPKFNEALQDFQRALPLFVARGKAPPPVAPNAGAVPAPGLDNEWLMRVRCDLAEMLIRTDKAKDAHDLIAGPATDPALLGSKYHAQAIYHLGYSSFAMRDYQGAGKALSQLAPFDQEFGLQARYLLGRVHHLLGEQAAAGQEYKAVVDAFEVSRKAAQQLLQKPQDLTEARKNYLEYFLNGPRPEYFTRSTFYLNVLLSEQGDYPAATTGLQPIAQQNPRTPLSDEAQLRVGYCFLQVRNFDEARRQLEPLRDNAEWGDQALWFMGRIPIAKADQNNAQAVQQAANEALDLFRRAADKANQIAQQPNHEDAKIRRQSILLELADAQQLIKQYAQAVETYRQVLNENPTPERAEEAMQRQVTALQMAAQYPASDELAQKFINTYPRSVLLSEVLFRHAENSYLVAAAMAAEPNRRHEESDPGFQESARRYQVVIDRFPESAQINLARQGLGNSYYRLGELDKAQEVLNQVPIADRAGDLSSVSYVLADCRIRQFPIRTDDALSAERLINGAQESIKQLTGYIDQQPKGPPAADALLKLGYCHQRIAEQSIDLKQRQDHYQLARQAYERIAADFNQSASVPVAVFERARCIAEMDDTGGAINELNRFQNDPFHASPIAPMAYLRAAVLQRKQKKMDEALAIITRCREQFEVQLLADTTRSSWVPMIQYEQGMCLQAAGKLPEAQTTFEILAKQFVNSPEALNATWRAGQCKRSALTTQLVAARTAAIKPDAKPEDVAAAGRLIEGLLTSIRQVGDSFNAQADTFSKTAPGSEAQLRTMYEVAWCQRLLGDAQVELTRQKMQRDVIRQLADKATRDLQPGQKPTVVVLPSVPMTEVPIQPAEQAARDQYKKLIAAAPDSPTANDARLELAELLSARADNDSAIDLLYATFEHGARGELAERSKLRLAAAFLGRHDPQRALQLLKAPPPSFPIPGTDTTQPPQPPQPVQPTPLTMEARYLMGETLIQLQDWPKAIEQLLVFRDADPYRGAEKLADRALARLGFAYAQAKQWDQSRQSYESLFQRFNQSPLVDEAHYGAGFAAQQAKQWDNAINQYREVITRSAGEVAARAQYQIGLCQLEAKRFPEAAQALVGVAYTYNYPEYSAAAQTEAARAYVEMKKPDDARKVLQRVMTDYPESPWAQTARQRLATVPQ